MNEARPHSATLSGTESRPCQTSSGMQCITRVARNVAYDTALRWQTDALSRMKNDPAEPQRLFLVEHAPTVTLGRSGDDSHLKVSRDALEAQGVAFRESRRGGDVTYHGPGQWTAYPLLRLKSVCPDLHRYMRLLEETVMRLLSSYGLRGLRIAGKTGVWLDAESPSGTIPEKISALGIAVSGWISYHGIAFNVCPELTAFREWITPCGIPASEGGVTSLADHTGDNAGMDAVARRWLSAFEEVFGIECVQESA